MSYIALARKYRPKNFNELVGQGILTTTLTNAIYENRLHHAFLLTGTRGVGKTTTARIIAKNVNCIGEDGKMENATVVPCEKCINCVSINNGSHPDVIEFDAASNTSIEDVKIIISNSHYAPIIGRKKVFIIDEVHMLSIKAFNALLKTLEEPGENIIFIFATTEVKKVPVTILSRCQKFFLKSIKQEEIANKLEEIIKLEGYEAEKEAISLISLKAEGSMRDALSILDQAILISKEKFITYSEVKEMLKIPSKEEALKLFDLIVQGKSEEVISSLEEAIECGMGEIEIAYELNEIICEKLKIELISEKEFGIPFLIRFYEILTKGIETLKNSENRKLALQVLFVKLIYSSSLPTPAEILEKLENKNLNFVLSVFKEGKIVEVAEEV